ncbi:hypothetical protein GQ600_23646 [Phytophthora cactorum]|nr:hypothetical protein GQ600_23646 [Phytophthora cactorum]
MDLEADALFGDLYRPVDLETQIQRHIAETSQADALFGEQLYRPVGEEEDDIHGKGRDEQLIASESDELERQRYLQRILSIEKGMQEADNEENPMEQLSEYLALKQEARREDDVDIVEDLVHCANRMTNEEDSEQPRTRGMAAMLPVVAAMMEASNGMDHPPF